MLPFIRTGNICRFEPIEPLRLRKGDVVLFVSGSGTLVGHRYFGQTFIGSERMFLCKGDSNVYPDDPVPADRIIGRMVWIRKPIGQYRASDPRLKLWAWLVTRVSFVSLTIHTYVKLIRKLRGMKNRLWAS
ncbi:hypothetical protein PAECIP111802_01858 [Paenibacillus allorhizosphaerae]|uniref:Signal peptidase I n=2 Tax=Paenibacillus allorhizosphaerae TaxID=2849866 RepID=A0ABM8VET9_9BACL|nr:hypothetical protein PAECIP111802_01858 [Paenibacillus allorhizosphaerae]